MDILIYRKKGVLSFPELMPILLADSTASQVEGRNQVLVTLPNLKIETARGFTYLDVSSDSLYSLIHRLEENGWKRHRETGRFISKHNPPKRR